MDADHNVTTSKISIIAVVFLSFLDKNEKLYVLIATDKKDIQESKSRGGKLFRLDNCQNKDCVYVHV